MWYTIVKRVPTGTGTGEYGSGHRVIADGQMLHSTMVRHVHLAETAGAAVQVFRGRTTGVLIYTSQEARP